MYDYFSGPVKGIDPTQVTLECGGIGYLLQISLFTYSHIKDKSTVKLFAHQVVREDAHLLFGFVDELERQVFRDLIAVSGVGAGTARMILSSLNPQEIKNVIASGDLPTLQRIKGIGAKTAQRILMELKDKIQKGPLLGATVSLPGSHNTGREEALSALLTLGFARVNAEKALQQASSKPSASQRVEDLIKSALAYL